MGTTPLIMKMRARNAEQISSKFLPGVCAFLLFVVVCRSSCQLVDEAGLASQDNHFTVGEEASASDESTWKCKSVHTNTRRRASGSTACRVVFQDDAQNRDQQHDGNMIALTRADEFTNTDWLGQCDDQFD